MAISASVQAKLEVTDTLALGITDVDDPTVSYSAGGATPVDMSAATTPVATAAWFQEVGLSAGAVTLDFTALARGNLSDLDLTGLTIQAWKIQADSQNTSPILMQEGDANPYYLCGATGDTISLDASDEFMFKGSDSLQAVAAGAKDIKVTSADVDAKFKLVLVAGAAA